MENQQSQPTDQQMLQEIYENTRKTKNYMKWQLIITVALIVIPLLATIAIIPFAMKSITNMYGISTDLNTLNGTNVQDLLQQYTQ